MEVEFFFLRRGILGKKYANIIYVIFIICYVNIRSKHETIAWLEYNLIVDVCCIGYDRYANEC